MMPNRLSAVAQISSHNRAFRNGALLATVSAFALLAISPGAYARPIGGAAPAPSAAAMAAAQSGSQEASRAARQAQNSLKRATLAIQSMQATQQAARDAARQQLDAMSSGIPHGLRPGGLEVAPGAIAGSALWQGADLPTEFADGDRTKVTIEQTQQKAILTWNTFNISEKTDLYFDQRAGGANASQWVALNRVLDPTVAPSRILGSIKAEGQVYVINGNGIIFGGTSQVNVGSLIVSSLSLSNAQFMAGIKTQLSGRVGNGANIDLLPTFGDVPMTDNPGAPAPRIAGNVTVEKGAQITAGKNGLIGLFATNVTNSGTLSTDGGQVLLAAGEQVRLVPQSIDSKMIGMRAYVSALPNYYTGAIFDPTYFQTLINRTALVGMVVKNDGLIAANAGNITVVGSTVIQNGIMRAVTTLDSPGSIMIAAEDSFLTSSFGGIKRRGGTVVFGEDSVTQVVVDASGVLGTGGSVGNSSILSISGMTVELKGIEATNQSDARGAYVQAQAGKIDIDLRGEDSNFNANMGEGFSVRPEAGPMAGTRFLMNAGAVLDVSGVVDVDIPMESNSVLVEVRANELRDSPLQRDGILRGAKIWVDRRVSGKRADGTIWYGSELVDAGEYIKNVPTSMAERAVNGGEIAIHSKDVIVKSGAAINIGGGSKRYADGYITTTKLRGENGLFYDVGNADPNLIYIAVGGGFTRSNARQKVTETWRSPLSKSGTTRFEKGYTEGAAAGTISIYAPVTVLDGDIYAQAVTGDRQVSSPPKGGSLKIGSSDFTDGQFNAQNVLLQASYAPLASNFAMTSAVGATRSSTLLLSNDLVNDGGFSNVEVHVNRNVTFASDVDIRLQPGASLNVRSETGGNSVVVDGSIRVAGGSVTLGGSGALTVKTGARIDVSGQWTSDFLSLGTDPRIANAGSIVLSATGNVLKFESGSVLAADAGATVSLKGALKVGNAGLIALEGGSVVGLNLVAMSAYGLAASDQTPLAPTGGTLDLARLSAISIGSGAGTVLDSSFFDRGGFSRFAFNVSSIQDGVTLAPQVQTRVLTPDYLSRASGTPISAIAAPTTLSDAQRPGVTLNMAFTGNFVLGANTTISSGTGGTVLLNGTGDITIAGKIDAPAGSIIISGNNVTVASTAQLLARGATRIVTDRRGARSGSVLNGGSVDLVAQNEINLSAGSLIDVSGTSGVIDILVPGEGFVEPTYRALTLASNGGSISISGTNGSVEGTLIGRPGGPGASGGNISFAMKPSSLPAPRADVEFLLSFMEPSCYGYGSGVCDGQTDWREGIGFDLGVIFNEQWGLDYVPVIITQALVDALPTTANGNIVVSRTATGAGGGLNPADYGLTPETLDYLLNQVGFDLSGSFRSVAPMLVRPASFQSGGFAGLSTSGTNLELDSVNLSFSGGISVQGSIVNRNGTTSRLTAPVISIGGEGVASPATAIAGQLTLQASVINVAQGGIRGYAQTKIETTDLRMGGGYGMESRLDVDGDLVIAAGQVYPTTQTSATITAGNSITILSNGNPVAPLSAGGKLTLSAPIIDQRGTLRAPFGEIVLDASDTLTLGAGSITSVSGAGLTVPYGYIVDQVLWYAGNPNTPITSPPEKRVTLRAPHVETKSGAIIDLSGGGDLQAYQFIPGSGGSSNYLSYGNAVAILPVSKISTTAGEQVIHLNGGNGIPAGDYVVMPASYALLPGAYRLEALAGTTDYTGSARLSDGSVVISGWSMDGSTGLRDPRSQAYKVSSIDTIRKYSEYKIRTANEYFASADFVEVMRRQLGTDVTAVPRLPKDAGALQIEATLSATLDATLLGAAEAGGRGAVIDISANKIAIVGGVDASGYRADGYLVLDAASLSAFGGESLLLGGKRWQTINGLEVDATASSLVVATDGTEANALRAPEILLASEDSIQIADGSLIEARGSVGEGSGNILIKPAIAAVTNSSGIVTAPARDYGAFVRVSSGAAVSVVRTNAERTQGTLAVDAATLRGKSILLDATMTTTVSGSAALLGQVLDVSSGRISIGTPSGIPDGLILSGGSLAALLGATDLRLRSYSSIDFYGDVALGGRNPDGTFKLQTLLLDAAALNGSTGTNVTVAAGEVAFTNTPGGTNVSLGGTGGALAIATNTLSFGAGTKAIDGFDTVQVSANTAIIARGTGSVDFGAANLAFSAPRLTAESGASQDWKSTGTFTLTGTPASGGFETLGARLAITAASISQGSLIDLTAGSLTLRATSGDVVLTAGSVTRASGFSRTFYDQRVDIAGGIVALVADNGRVWAQVGSLIDVSHSGNGAAGTLSIATPQHEAQLDGDLKAGSGGNFVLDASAVSAFGTLSAKLRQGGFDGDLNFRLRAGDVILDGETRARSFALATDAGSITVTGTIDASGAAAGIIRLSAKQDLTVAGGAAIRANAGDANKNSGVIELSAAEGDMRLEANATIEALDGRNGNGEIRLRFRRDDTAGTVKLADAHATMTAANIVAEAYRGYDTTSVGASLPGALADAASFMSTYAAAIKAGFGLDTNTGAIFHLVPGVELSSSSDLTLTSAVDLHSARYNGEAGVLTLRAAGNLVLNGSLSDGFASAAANAAVSTDPASWSYRLVGGADLGAADALAVRPMGSLGSGATGNVGLGNGVIVRTGTGSISLAAANDVVLADKTSVIYTAGARIADPSLGGTYTGNSFNPVFTHGGGDVRVTAQNDIKTLTASDQMIVDWLWWEGVSNTSIFPSESNDGAFAPNQQTAWWIHFSSFQQGIAALGGGNVTVEAGRDLVNVSASTPTQGRVGGGRTAAEAKTVAITGGGDLTVKAGRDIVGGVYYVDGGTGTIQAGGAITSDRVVSYDIDGSDPRPAYNARIRTVLALGNAALTVTAGGSIDLASASNPTRWSRSNGQVAGSQGPYSSFSTYGENSALTLLSTGGDVTLWNTPVHYLAAVPAWVDYYDGNDSTQTLASDSMVYYPGRMTVIAAAGDITIQGGMVVAPSATGNLDLWAQNSIYLRLSDKSSAQLDGAVTRTLVLSDVSPDKIGSVLRPMQYRFPVEGFYPADATEGTGPGSGPGYRQDVGLLHEADYEPSRIYANEGSITEGYPGNGGLRRSETYAEQVWFRAGLDINNLHLRAQNNRDSDLSLFWAGRDINLNKGNIAISGPGFALAEAGRDVFLGRGGGIETVGNKETGFGPGIPKTVSNLALPRDGADLLVLAGTADGPRYDAFIDAYLDPTRGAMNADYSALLVSFMGQVTGNPNLSVGAALAAIRDPRFADHRKFLIDKILSRELRAAGRGQLDGLGDKGLGYERGYMALATLFPGAELGGNTAWQGDVIMDVSMIRTYRGGDVNILAPGGMLQVSVLSSNSTGDHDGVLTINGGEIRITTGLGTIINKSRVLTARGGDITIWSTFGDIDAGKGRKSALTTPASTYQLSPDGNISYEVNPSFSGSGISTQKGAPDAAISDVDLYAPNGIINAGDAGIRVSGNVYLGALQILGAENIQAGGEIKGVPKPTQSAASLSVETKDRTAADAAKDATQAHTSPQPSIIIVEVLGFGGGDGNKDSDSDEEKRRKGSDNNSQRQDPVSAVQVIGAGDLSPIQRQKLTITERRNFDEP